jgi:hypothetical protein
VVIVDEYEKPVHDHLNDLPLATQLRDVLGGFYGALKTCDEHIEKLFITGVGRMVRTSMFSSLNQLSDATLTREAAEICGYTEAELHREFAGHVGGLAQANDLTIEATWNALRQRYNGYWWGKGEHVYNPWSILCSLRKEEFGSYWWDTGASRMLVNLAASLERPDLDLENLTRTDNQLLISIEQLSTIALLWQAGYLTIKSAGGSPYTLGFPNAEVREAWYGMLLGYFSGSNGEELQSSAAAMLKGLTDGDRSQFERSLKALFAGIPGQLHLTPEAWPHSIFYTAIQAAGGQILAESRTDKGLIDAVIETPKTICIVEFKLGTAQAALEQIKARRYYERYAADLRPTLLLGVGGFAERDVQCVWEVVER